MVGELTLGNTELPIPKVLNALRHLWLVNMIFRDESFNALTQVCSTPYGIYGW